MTSNNSNRISHILRQIQETSDAFRRSVFRPGFPSAFIPSDRLVQPLVLPNTPDILPDLEATGASYYFILQEFEKFENSCLALRQKVEETYLKVTKDIPSAEYLPDSSSRKARILENDYRRRLHELKARAISRARRVSHRTSSKVRFNQDSTPLLKRFFKDNAYPSAASRAMLAQKTSMTPRQIEVWFQNRRRRAKAEGIPLARCPSKANLDEYSLDDFDFESCSTSTSRARSASSIFSESSDEGRHLDIPPPRTAPLELVSRWISRSQVDIVKFCRPSHAFPTRFTPDKIPSPTPQLLDFKWDRTAAPNASSHPKPHGDVVDIATLSLEFQTRLKLFDRPNLKRKREEVSALHSRESTSDPLPDALQTTQWTHEDVDAVPMRPHKRRLVSPTKLFHCRVSPDHSITRSRAPDSLTPRLNTPPLSRLTQQFFRQRLDWQTSKFVEWSSIPNLTLSCLRFDLPFVR